MTYLTKLTYNGAKPVHTLRGVWGKGSSKTIDQIFNDWKDRCPVSSSLDEGFVNWFVDKYVRNLDSDWEFVYHEDDFNTEKGIDLITEDKQSTKTVTLESSTLETADSEKEARNRLRNMRHPDEVGVVERTKPKSSVSSDIVERISHIDPPGSNVMTGDDLDPSQSQSVSKAKVLSATPTGEFVVHSAMEKSKQDEVNRGLSELSKRVNVLRPEQINPDGSRVQVITGDDFATSITITSDRPHDDPVPAQENKELEGKRNKTKAYTSAQRKQEITVMDIVRETKEEHATQLINQCTDTRVLRIARASCYDQGLMHRYEEINNRLRNLPLHMM